MNTLSDTIVVSHDAGAAEIVSAYITQQSGTASFHCYVSGPAERVFLRRGIPIVSLATEPLTAAQVLDRHPEARLLITSPSLVSFLPAACLEEATRRSLKTVVYLDHWVNYRERFGYPRDGWDERLPDELWVGDQYAHAIAEQQFSGHVIRLVPNVAFQEVPNLFAQAQRGVREQPQAILYMSEPISEPINTFGDHEKITFTERDVLEQLLQWVSGPGAGHLLIVRLHPSEPRDKYVDILSRAAANTVVLSDVADIYKDIARAPVVVGIDSMALVFAMLCGRRVFSLFPDPHRACDLPFSEIVKLKSVEELTRALA